MLIEQKENATTRRRYYRMLYTLRRFKLFKERDDWWINSFIRYYTRDVN